MTANRNSPGLIRHQGAKLILLLIVCSLSLSCPGQKYRPNDNWSQVQDILKRIIPPEFPASEFNIIDYGAVGDGNTDCTEAFKKAIAACHRASGGKVIVPRGQFLTGAIHLKSQVNLYISEGAIIRFCQDAKHYLPVVYTRFEGVECLNYSPLIYAYEQENIAITGRGVLDGQAMVNVWWHWKGPWNNSENMPTGWDEGEPDQRESVARLQEMANNNVPVRDRIFGEGSHLRPNFIQPYRCKNVLIESVTIKNSPMWAIHPVLCSNVTIKNVTIESLGPNNDGCDPESCIDILIKDCFFNTGDDCIAIKSGRNADGRRVNVPSENIVIQGCQMKNGHGGVTIGSEVSGNVRNVFAEDCVMDSPELDRALRMKTNSLRGGIIDNIFLRNIAVGQVKEAAIRIDMFYGNDRDQFYPVIRNIHIKNLTCQKSSYALIINGYENSPVSQLYIEDCQFHNVSRGNIQEHVENLILKNVYINGKQR